VIIAAVDYERMRSFKPGGGKTDLRRTMYLRTVGAVGIAANAAALLYAHLV
jgi:hypothetical protein